MAAGKIDIGAHVVIAPNVYISDHSHKYDDISCPISEQGIDKISRVIIGEESWIGHGAVILPGTNIGKHCVIGANSVVSGNIKDYSIVVGIPANVKKRFNFDTNTWEKVG
jgi:acetyltransferase-like isoleucine patch superfamily enzyme